MTAGWRKVKKREEGERQRNMHNDIKTWWKKIDKRVTNILTDDFARIVFPLTICACEVIRNRMCQELFQPTSPGWQREM